MPELVVREQELEREQAASKQSPKEILLEDLQQILAVIVFHSARRRDSAGTTELDRLTAHLRQPEPGPGLWGLVG